MHGIRGGAISALSPPYIPLISLTITQLYKERNIVCDIVGSFPNLSQTVLTYKVVGHILCTKCQNCIVPHTQAREMYTHKMSCYYIVHFHMTPGASQCVVPQRWLPTKWVHSFCSHCDIGFLLLRLYGTHLLYYCNFRQSIFCRKKHSCYGMCQDCRVWIILWEHDRVFTICHSSHSSRPLCNMHYAAEKAGPYVVYNSGCKLR